MSAPVIVVVLLHAPETQRLVEFGHIHGHRDVFIASVAAHTETRHVGSRGLAFHAHVLEHGCERLARQLGGEVDEGCVCIRIEHVNLHGGCPTTHVAGSF